MQKVVGEGLQRRGFSLERLERGEGFCGELRGDLAGFFEADDRRVSRFLRGDIFPGGLAQFLAGLRHIQNVVDDLEGETDVVTETGEGAKLRRCAVGTHAAEARGTAEQGAGFAFMNVAELRKRCGFVFALEIGDLTGNELKRTRSAGEFEHERMVRITRGGLRLNEDFKSLRQQCVASKNGDAFAKNLVTGRLATPEIVVVHRGQVIVDE